MENKERQRTLIESLTQLVGIRNRLHTLGQLSTRIRMQFTDNITLTEAEDEKPKELVGGVLKRFALIISSIDSQVEWIEKELHRLNEVIEVKQKSIKVQE